MSKRHTLNDQIAGLDAIDAANGDYQVAHAASGFSAAQLRAWDKQRETIRSEQHHYERERDARMLHDLRSKLAERALRVIESMDDETIAKAPLNQLASALGVLVDRYLKLDDAIPEQVGEQVIRLEYKYPDGSIHSTPPWAEDDSEQQSTLQSGGVRQTLRQDGDGQDRPDGSGLAGQTRLVARPDLPDGESGLAGFEDHLDERPWYHD